MFAERPDGSCKLLAERLVQGNYLLLGLRAQLLDVRVDFPVHIGGALGKYPLHLRMGLLNVSRQISRCLRKLLTRVPDTGVYLARQLGYLLFRGEVRHHRPP